MLCLSRNNLEAIGKRVLRDYWRLPEAIEEPNRVIPELLLTRLLGLKIDYRHLSGDGCTLGMTTFSYLGMELYDSAPGELYRFDGKTVLIEKDLLQAESEGRRNFTLIHEGSHHILNSLFPGEYAGGISERQVLKYRVSGARLNRQSQKYWEEWQTDALTSPILMPEDLLRRHLMDHGYPNGMFRLNRLFQHKEYKAFVDICTKMGVSKQALAYRMERLGLLKENHLRNPYAIADVWRDDNDEQ